MSPQRHAMTAAYRLMCMSRPGDRTVWPPPAQDIALGCLDYHRADVTKALRFVGHVIALYRKTPMTHQYKYSVAACAARGWLKDYARKFSSENPSPSRVGGRGATPRRAPA